MADESGNKLPFAFPHKFKQGELIRIVRPVTVPRSRCPDFCAALHDIAMSIGGGNSSSYDPRFGPDKGRCSWHWHLPHDGKEYGLLISISALVKAEGIDKLAVGIGPGQHFSGSRELVLSREDYDKARGKIEDILAEAGRIVRGEVPTWHVAFFAKGQVLNSRLAEFDGDLVVPSRTQRELPLVTAFVLKTKAVREGCAERRLGLRPLRVKVLFEALSGYSKELIPRAGFMYGTAFPEVPDEDALYNIVGETSRELTDLMVRSAFDMSPYCEAVLQLASEWDRSQDDCLLRAVHAFSEGLAVLRASPALAGIAFNVAASAFLSGPVQQECNQGVECPECGRSLRHPPKGEVARLVELLEQTVFAGRQWPRRETERVLKTFYREQRSAFVHGARMVFQGRQILNPLEPFGPSASSLVHPVTMCVQHMMTMQGVARLLICHQLARRFGAFESLAAKLGREFRPSQVGPGGSVRLGHSAVDVGGFRIPQL